MSNSANASAFRCILGKSVVLVILCGHLLVSVVTWSLGTNSWLVSLPITTSSLDEAPASPSETIAALTQGNQRDARSTTFFMDHEYHDIRAPLFVESIPLAVLVNTDLHPECKSTDKFEMSLYPSIQPPKNNSTQINPSQKIPKIIHMTAKSRCMTAKIRANIRRWEALPGYTIYFHDDAAVDRLMAKYWPEFPHLSLAAHCSISGAAKADIWRYLVLWEYGGLYTDIDNAPGRQFDQGRVIAEDDQAWFAVERVGVPSQYFMAGIPKHPFFHTALLTCLSRLIDLVEEIGTQYVPYITGPGVTKAAMMIYMKDFEKFQTVVEGKYTGLDGTTVTIKGRKQKERQYIKRESIEKKQQDYRAMDMKHFSNVKNKNFRDSCYEHLYKIALKMKRGNGTESK